MRTYARRSKVQPLNVSNQKYIKLTDEQEEILRTVQQTQHVAINAFAGTGKTTTLRAIAEQNKGQKILYLAYNRKMAEEARKKFVGVDVKTVHSLAYQRIVKNSRAGYDLANLSTYLIKTHLNLEWNHAKTLLDLFNIYLQSEYTDFDDPNFISSILNNTRFMSSLFHDVVQYNKKRNNRQEDEDNDEEDMQWIDITEEEAISRLNDLLDKIDYSNRFESLIKLIEKRILPMPHDYYLKQYQIGLLDGRFKDDYDIVLLDEAQDSNMITMSIFKSIGYKDTKRILVGDRYQQIYYFRGAMNIMKYMIDNYGYTPKYLTYSFRFNQDIADHLNKILRKYALDFDENLCIKGMGNQESDTQAVVSRTNYTLIDYFEVFNDFSIGRDIHEIFKLPIQVYYHANREYDRLLEHYKFWVQYEDLPKLKEMAEESNDTELKNAIRVYEKYKGTLPDLYRSGLKKLNPYSKNTLTTAHSSKGLEYGTVYITNDYPNLWAKREMLASCPNKYALEHAESMYQEEVNLYYVACSRAIKMLIDRSINA